MLPIGEVNNFFLIRVGSICERINDRIRGKDERRMGLLPQRAMEIESLNIFKVEIDGH